MVRFGRFRSAPVSARLSWRLLQMENENSPKKNERLCIATASTVEELREIAFWFSDRGMTDNSKFCANAASQLEILSGAYATALAREVSAK